MLDQGLHCCTRDWWSCWDTSFQDFLLEWFVTPFPIFSLLWLSCVVTWWCATNCEVSVGCILCASNPVILTCPPQTGLHKEQWKEWGKRPWVVKSRLYGVSLYICLSLCTLVSCSNLNSLIHCLLQECTQHLLCPSSRDTEVIQNGYFYSIKY